LKWFITREGEFEFDDKETDVNDSKTDQANNEEGGVKVGIREVTGSAWDGVVLWLAGLTRCVDGSTVSGHRQSEAPHQTGTLVVQYVECFVKLSESHIW
jgi:hypothetical protein